MERLRYFAMVLFLLVGMVAAAQTTRIRTQHKVAKGETIFGIAKSYEVTMEDLIEVNPPMKEVGYELKKGDILNIPFSKKPQQPAGKPATSGRTTGTSRCPSRLSFRPSWPRSKISFMRHPSLPRAPGGSLHPSDRAYFSR